MANTLSNLSDVRVSQVALDAFKKAMIPFRAFSTKLSDEPAEHGDTVNVKLIGDADESEDFTGSYTAGMQNADATGVPVTLNRHKHQTFALSAKEMSTKSVTTDDFIGSKAARLALDVLNDILTIVTAANFPGAHGPVVDTDFDFKELLAVRKKCGDQNMPPEHRACVLDAGFYTNLIAEDVIAKSFNLRLSGDGVEEARVQRVAGFDLLETNVIPSDHAEFLKGFAAHPSAIAVAMRHLLPVPGAYDEASAITDPDTGLTIGYKRWASPDGNKLIITLEAFYGFAKGKSDALVRIVDDEEEEVGG